MRTMLLCSCRGTTRVTRRESSRESVESLLLHGHLLSLRCMRDGSSRSITRGAGHHPLLLPRKDHLRPLALLGEMVLLDVDGVDLGPGNGAHVHGVVLGDGAPVPALGGEFEGIASRHGLKLSAIGPHAIAHPLRVVAAHGDRYDGN